MNRFSALSGIQVRHDGREVKFTINASAMKPTEIAVDDTDLEELTLAFLQMALLCAEKQGIRPVTDGKPMYAPLRLGNYGIAASAHPGDMLVVIPLGLFSLGFSVPDVGIPTPG